MLNGRYSPYLPRRNTKIARQRKALLKRIGWEAYQKGRRVEEKFKKSFMGCFKKPEWFFCILKTENNSEEDRKGKDFIALTRFCDFGIQIKSSEVGVEKFKEKNKGFFGIILIIKLYYTYEQILTLFFEEAEEFLKKIPKQNRN